MRKGPLVASAFCLFFFGVVRWYASETCNGQRWVPKSLREVDPHVPQIPFCWEHFRTPLSLFLDAASLALPICAIGFAILAFRKPNE